MHNCAFRTNTSTENAISTSFHSVFTHLRIGTPTSGCCLSSSAQHSVQSHQWCWVETWGRQSHFLYFGAQHQITPGLCAQPLPVHTVHPWLHSPQVRELNCELCGRHHHRLLHYKQCWEFHIWRKSTILQNSAQSPNYTERQHPAQPFGKRHRNIHCYTRPLSSFFPQGLGTPQFIFHTPLYKILCFVLRSHFQFSFTTLWL